MTMSREPDSLFKKFVIMTRFLIKGQGNLPNLVLLLLLLSEQKIGGQNPPCGIGLNKFLLGPFCLLRHCGEKWEKNDKVIN